MKQQMIKIWRNIGKTPVLQDFIRGCYYGLNNIETQYNDALFPKTYNGGRKNARESGKTYCILKLPPSYYCMFETWQAVAFMAMTALADGYIPVVDLRGYRSNYSKDKFLRTQHLAAGNFSKMTTNFWEIFFNQYQQNISLEEVYRSGNYVVISFVCRDATWITNRPSHIVCESYHKIYQRMGINEQVLQETEKKELPKQTLGVLICRNLEWGNRLGMPFYTERACHHARTHLQVYERWLDENLHRLGFDHFLLATDDRASAEFFQEKFGDSCICADRKFRRLFDGNRPLNPEIEAERKVLYQEFSDDPTARVKEMEIGYISETLLLSKCGALLSSRMGQEMMARVMSDRDIPLIDTDIHLDMFYWR